MAVMKEMQFPVSIRWRGGHLARADAGGRESLEIATPPEFRGGLAGYWSPEELLVAATATCFALTLAAVAERRQVPLLDAAVGGTGHMGRRADGRYGFTVIELSAVLDTLPGNEDGIAAAADAARDRCFVTRALDVPVHVGVEIRTAGSEATAVARAG